MQYARLSNITPFSYPVYLLSQSQIAEVKNEKEMGHFESWILYDEMRRYTPGDMRPFDANFVLLSHRDVFGRGGALGLYIDKKRDHSEDSTLMKSMLVAMLTLADDADDEDEDTGSADNSENGSESRSEDYQQYGIEHLLPLAIQRCSTL